MGTVDATALDIKVLIKYNDKTVYKDGINKNYLGTLKTSTLAIRSTTRATTTTTVKTTLSPVLADFAETPKILTNGTTDSTKTEKPPDSPKSKIVNVVFDKTDFQKFKFDYPDALKKSIKFYYAQRSGIIKDKKIPWRGSSALEDKGDNEESLVGGFYDAGDHLKLTFPMAYSMTVLAWGILEYWDVYQALGVRNEAIGVIKWGCDWLLKANPEDFVLYGQVGDNKTDHAHWESARVGARGLGQETNICSNRPLARPSRFALRRLAV